MRARNPSSSFEKRGRTHSQSHSTCLPSTLLRDGKLNPRDSRALYKKLRKLRENRRFSECQWLMVFLYLPHSFLMDCDSEAAETKFIPKSKTAALYNVHLVKNDNVLVGSCVTLLVITVFTSKEVS